MINSKHIVTLLAVLASTPFSRAAQPPADGPVRVVTTLPVLADLARQVGGDHVSVQALGDPRQDPHYVQPRPTLMRKAHDADLFVEVGLQLELWGEKVVQGSGNPRIQMGQPGRVIASQGIPTLELPTQLSREWGDVHPYGNPHLWLDPINASEMAANIATGLERVDPAHAEDYRRGLETFQRRIAESLFGPKLVEEIGASKLERLSRRNSLERYLERHEMSDELGGWLAKARPLRGAKVVTYHKTWIYFSTRFGFEIPVEIEEKPGIPPSAKHRDHVLRTMRDQGVHTILQAIFYDRTAADWLAQRADARVVVVPIDVGGVEGAADYFGLIDTILGRLVEAQQAEH